MYFLTDLSQREIYCIFVIIPLFCEYQKGSCITTVFLGELFFVALTFRAGVLALKIKLAKFNRNSVGNCDNSEILDTIDADE